MPQDRVLASAGIQKKPLEETQMVPMSLVESFLAKGWKLRNPESYFAAKANNTESVNQNQQTIQQALPPLVNQLEDTSGQSSEQPHEAINVTNNKRTWKASLKRLNQFLLLHLTE
eukprot:gnl/Chilomastix_caulleri/4155.p1 GENE.gnl/Chilomastix_caulleri/4155~~gnl/Chilomastix_caulleri/4155.p1  ORF type:complete len:115 (+),score=24.76 gnl/Chilomastix_caulleri/4155:54-398(+)